MNKRTQTGLTLIELLVSMLLGIVVVGGVTTAYVSISGSATTTLSQNKLNSQLASIMTMMVRDIRRAGYRGNQTAADLLDPSTNVFNLVDDTALEVHTAANVEVAGGSNTVGTCVVYAYDRDDDGLLDNNEITGFRLNGGGVEMRTSGDTAANARHDACNDADDTWADLSDPATVTVTQFALTVTNSECLNTREPDGIDNDGANGIDDAAEADCYAQAAAVGDITVETRQVTIAMTGQSVADPNITATIAQDVRARNDLVRIN